VSTAIQRQPLVCCSAVIGIQMLMVMNVMTTMMMNDEDDD